MNLNKTVVAMTTIIAFLMGIVAYPTFVQPEITTQPIVEKEVINNTKVVKKDRSFDNQATHIQANPSTFNGELTVDNVDVCGKLYGLSMRPTIFDGNTVCSRNYTGQDLEEGMIIRYKDGNSHTIHRIQGNYQKRGFVVTQGDNLPQTTKVKLDDITHVVVATIYT